MLEGLNQLGEYLAKSEGAPNPKATPKAGNPVNGQYSYGPPNEAQNQAIGQTDTGQPIALAERGPHSVNAWGEVLVGKTAPGHEQAAPRHLEHDGKHWIRAGFDTNSNTVGYHEYQPARHLMDPTTGFAREAVPVDAKGVSGGLFHVAGLPEHGGGDLPSEINDPHHGKLTVRGFNSDSNMTLYHKDVHNPGWNKPGSTGEAKAGSTPPGTTPPPQEGQNAPATTPPGAPPPVTRAPGAPVQPGPPTVAGQPGKPPAVPATTGPQTAPKPPLPGGPGAPQPMATGSQGMGAPKPGSSPQMPLVGQGQPPRPPVAGSPQAAAEATKPGAPMMTKPPTSWQTPGQPGTPPMPPGMKPPMAGPAGAPPAGIQPVGPKQATPPPGTPPPHVRHTPGSTPNLPPEPANPAQGALPKPGVPAARPAPPVKPAVGAKKNPFQKSGLDALGDWMQKAVGEERAGHKYETRTGVSGHYHYTYADDNRTTMNSPGHEHLDRQLPGTKITFAGGPNKGVSYVRQDDGTWHGDGDKIDNTSMASRTFGNPMIVHHPVGEKKQMAPHMHVIAKDGSGAYIVSIGDPTKGGSKLKRRFSGPTAESDLREWVRDNVGETVSHNHIMDATGHNLVPAYHHPSYGPTTKGPTGKVTKRDAQGREHLDFEATAANAKNMTDAELDGALKDIHATLDSADKLDREQGTDRGGLYRDEASVYNQEKARRAKGKKPKAEKKPKATPAASGEEAPAKPKKLPKEYKAAEEAFHHHAEAVGYTDNPKEKAWHHAQAREAATQAEQHAYDAGHHDKAANWRKDIEARDKTVRSYEAQGHAPEKPLHVERKEWEDAHGGAYHPESVAHWAKQHGSEDHAANVRGLEGYRMSHLEGLAAGASMGHHDPSTPEGKAREALLHGTLAAMRSKKEEGAKHENHQALATLMHNLTKREHGAPGKSIPPASVGSMIAADSKDSTKVLQHLEDGNYDMKRHAQHHMATADYDVKAKAKAKPQQGDLFAKKSMGLEALGDWMQKAEAIPGGLASGKEPEDFDRQALSEGQKVEMEHTYNPKTAREIAMDHLTEDPNYYRKLKMIEKSNTLPGKGATTEKCMNKAMTGLEALSGYLSKSLEDPMPDDAVKLGYGKSKEVGESPDGGDLAGPTRDFKGDRVGDAKGGTGGQPGTTGIGAPAPAKSVKANKPGGEKLDVGGDPSVAKSARPAAGAGTPEDVGGNPSIRSDALNEEERDPEDQMSPGKTAIEDDVSEKSLTPAGQRAMVAREHALKVQELTKSTDVRVGTPDHPYMMSSMGDVDAATEGLLKSEFYQGESPTLSQPGTMLRKSVMCKSEACGISYPAFYTACPECGTGQTTNRLMPHSHEIGGGGSTRLEKSKNDPILQPRPEEPDLMVGAPENVVLFRTRR